MAKCATPIREEKRAVNILQLCMLARLSLPTTHRQSLIVHHRGFHGRAWCIQLQKNAWRRLGVSEIHWIIFLPIKVNGFCSRQKIKIFSPEQLLYPPSPYHLMGKFSFTYNGNGLCCSTFVGHTISFLQDTHAVYRGDWNRIKTTRMWQVLLHLLNTSIQKLWQKQKCTRFKKSVWQWECNINIIYSTKSAKTNTKRQKSPAIPGMDLFHSSKGVGVAELHSGDQSFFFKIMIIYL